MGFTAEWSNEVSWMLLVSREGSNNLPFSAEPDTALLCSENAKEASGFPTIGVAVTPGVSPVGSSTERDFIIVAGTLPGCINLLAELNCVSFAPLPTGDFCWKWCAGGRSSKGSGMTALEMMRRFAPLRADSMEDASGERMLSFSAEMLLLTGGPLLTGDSISLALAPDIFGEREKDAALTGPVAEAGFEVPTPRGRIFTAALLEAR